jgi:hypothetical protein
VAVLGEQTVPVSTEPVRWLNEEKVFTLGKGRIGVDSLLEIDERDENVGRENVGHGDVGRGDVGRGNVVRVERLERGGAAPFATSIPMTIFFVR